MGIGAGTQHFLVICSRPFKIFVARTPPIRLELTEGLKKHAKDCVSKGITQYTLDKVDLERYGMQFIVRTRLDWLCIQLSSPTSGRLTTRCMLSVNAQLAPYIPDPRKLRAAELAAQSNPGFRNYRLAPTKNFVVSDMIPLPRTSWLNIAVLGEDFAPMGQELIKASPVRAEVGRV
eukprot:Gregarina_sp_Poly_1__1794@NODE_1465_length_4068_cov_574_937766_g969_i0_p3_GENE_NODE_1465_length_4068_cov_574_937766_g969_i0NODE_1465_length_4068_cov_574_937766_g969_i0_p3_ORF_typecomplete_len176_score12_15_NODE_1465_length_4068_cov_574_937766_g969_i033653892